MKKLLMVMIIGLMGNFSTIHSMQEEEGVNLFLQDVAQSFGYANTSDILQVKQQAPKAEFVIDGLKKLEKKMIKRGLSKQLIAQSVGVASTFVESLIDDIPAEVLEINKEENRCVKNIPMLVNRYFNVENNADRHALFAVELEKHLEQCYQSDVSLTSKVVAASGNLESIFKQAYAKKEKQNPQNKKLYDKINDQSDKVMLLGGIQLVFFDAYKSEKEKAYEQADQN
jgi:hypothetical protein